MKRIAILGSTGSIGASTLSICESFPDRYQPIAFAAGRNIDIALSQCQRWRPKLISVATEELAADLRTRLKQAGLTETEVLHGTPGTVAVATHPEIDFVVSAIVGVAGLEATYAAVLAGKTIGLANKECLVAAGDLIMRAARDHNVRPPPHRLRAQRRPPGHARRQALRSQANLAHRVRRPLPQHARSPTSPTSPPSRPSSTPPGSWASASRLTPPP